MTDKEYREQKKRIQKLIDKWVHTLGLDWWEIIYEYVRGEHDGSETNYMPFTGKGSRYACIMEVSTDYYYRTARMTFYLQTCIDYDDAALERYFVHECMHIFLKAMQTKQKASEEELVATSLASAVIWAREEGRRDAGR
jgi:hypothetical protein